MRISKSWTTVTPLSKFLAMILFIALPFLGFYLGTKYQASNIDLSPSNNWLIYQEPQNYFSFQYPQNWKLSFNPKDPESISSMEIPQDKTDINLVGPEGEILITWVNGYGGACEVGYEKIKLKNEFLDTCHSQKNINHQDGESWEQISKKLDLKSSLGVYINAFANQPTSKNRETILKILSTFEFNLK